MRPAATPTGIERFFDDDEIIVSKTDLKGIITYANDVFLRVSGYSEEELLGQPHNLIRHPDMPRCVFQLLWDTIASGNEIFAYVVNLAKAGDHYWVLAHVTPTFGPDGKIIGYHSSRRVPGRKQVSEISRIYAALRKTEAKYSHPKEAIAAASELMAEVLADAGKAYEEFVFCL
jgi:PAS domain S-box-containing protein